MAPVKRAISTHRIFSVLARRAAPIVIVCAVFISGCRSYQPFGQQCLPAEYTTVSIQAPGGQLLRKPIVATPQPSGNFGIANANADLHDATSRLEQAIRLDRAGHSQSVDIYFSAAIDSWRCFSIAASGSAADQQADVCRQVYQESLSGLLDAGQRYHRLDPSSHLTVFDGNHWQTIPIVYRGLAWQPAEFGQLRAAGSVRAKDMANYYATPGLGVALVAFRPTHFEERFLRPRQPFAVTALLRPTTKISDGEMVIDGSTPGPSVVLEFYNPHTHDAVEVDGQKVRLARDLSAPLAEMDRNAPNLYFEGFVAPDDADVKPKLVMLEPYQPGKIPVVFIHGLFSDPLAWLDVVNEFRATPEFYQRYQFWMYRYPTGGGLLESAAALRENLRIAREQFDPEHQDKSLDKMVLIGHSLGGILAKFQVTSSGDTLWRTVAKQPLDAVRAGPAARAELAQLFFFDPVCSVRRVVFVGTPFQGSNQASRVVGRVSSRLVRFGEQEDIEYQRLMKMNRDIFREYLWRSRPTSVDILEPDSPLLETLERLPVNPDVCLHTIIGTGALRLIRQTSDGVVDVSSAQQPGVESESYVDARHSELRRDPATIVELARILREHAAQP